MQDRTRLCLSAVYRLLIFIVRLYCLLTEQLSQIRSVTKRCWANMNWPDRLFSGKHYSTTNLHLCEQTEAWKSLTFNFGRAGNGADRTEYRVLVIGVETIEKNERCQACWAMVARRISRTTSLLCTYRLFSLSGIFTSVAFFPSKVPPSATRLCLLGQHTSPNRFCLGQRNSFLQYNFSILILIYIYQLRPFGSSPGCSDASRSETVPKSIFQDISISGRFGVSCRYEDT